MSKKKLLMIVGPVMLLVLLFGVKTFVLGGSPPPDEAKLAKTPGPVFTMTQPFVINLAAGDGKTHFAKVGVAMRLSELSAPLLVAGPSADAPLTVEDEPELRDIVIATVQRHSISELSRPAGREAVKRQIMRRVNKETEVKITDVYYTEFAVQ